MGAGLFAVSTIGPARSGRDAAGSAATVPVLVGEIGSSTGLRFPPGGSLDEMIASLETRVVAVPGDDVAWATLGLAYVQQAKFKMDFSMYPRADEVLAQSLEINDTDNFLAFAGLSALASARHDFVTARGYAEQGLEINAYSPLLYGALGDSLVQTGDYDGAFAAVQRMVDLSPDTASLSRASYMWELRGDVDRARMLMQRALDDAPTSADRAFALVHLGDMSLEAGDANAALTSYLAALAAAPDDIAALVGKAEAEAALGQIETAISDFETVVARSVEPAYFLDFGRLLQSTGRTDEAEAQYALFEQAQQRMSDQGIGIDAEAIVFAVDRGQAEQALALAEANIATRPFVEMHDAYAWALYGNGRFREALDEIDAALALGTRDPMFHFHAGMIAIALGDTVRARSELTAALDINPAFDFIAAPLAVEALASPSLAP